MCALRLDDPEVLEKCELLERELYKNLRNSKALVDHSDKTIKEWTETMVLTETEDSTYTDDQGEELITMLECLVDESFDDPLEMIQQRIS